LRLIDDLLKHPRSESAPMTDLAPLLETGRSAIKRRSLVFIISDFISKPGWERPLNLLNQRHEVLAIRLFDPRATERPHVWPVMLALLLVIPLGVLAWLRLGRRRLARLGALGGLAAAPVPAARTGGVRVRRRITAGLFVLGSAVMVVALARPQAVVSVPKL